MAASLNITIDLITKTLNNRQPLVLGAHIAKGEPYERAIYSI